MTDRPVAPPPAHASLDDVPSQEAIRAAVAALAAQYGPGAAGKDAVVLGPVEEAFDEPTGVTLVSASPGVAIVATAGVGGPAGTAPPHADSDMFAATASSSPDILASFIDPKPPEAATVRVAGPPPSDPTTGLDATPTGLARSAATVPPATVLAGGAMVATVLAAGTSRPATAPPAVGPAGATSSSAAGTAPASTRLSPTAVPDTASAVARESAPARPPAIAPPFAAAALTGAATDGLRPESSAATATRSGVDPAARSATANAAMATGAKRRGAWPWILALLIGIGGAVAWAASRPGGLSATYRDVHAMFSPPSTTPASDVASTGPALRGASPAAAPSAAPAATPATPATTATAPGTPPAMDNVPPTIAPALPAAGSAPAAGPVPGADPPPVGSVAPASGRVAGVDGDPRAAQPPAGANPAPDVSPPATAGPPAGASPPASANPAPGVPVPAPTPTIPSVPRLEAAQAPATMAPAVTPAGGTAPPAAAPVPSGAATSPTVAGPSALRFDVARVGSDGRAVIAGRGEPGDVVVLLDGDKEVARVLADSRGEWVALVNDPPLAPGAHALRAARRTASGALQPAGQVVSLLVPQPAPPPVVVPDPAAPTANRPAVGAGPALAAPADAPLVVVGPADGAGGSRVLQGPALARSGDLVLGALDYDDRGRLTLSGQARPGEAVRVYLNNAVLGDTTAGPDGRWVLAPSLPVPHGPQTLRVDRLGGPAGAVAQRLEVPFRRVAVTPGGSVEIVRGDSLWHIATARLGQGTRFTAIYEANRGLIRDPNLIYPGQVFVIPKAP